MTDMRVDIQGFKNMQFCIIIYFQSSLVSLNIIILLLISFPIVLLISC